MCDTNIRELFDDDRSYRLFQKIIAISPKNIAPFIGAGMVADMGFKTWQAFLNSMIDGLRKNHQNKTANAAKQALRQYSYLEAAEIIDHGIEEELGLNHNLSMFVCREYAPKERRTHAVFVELLRKLGCTAFLTTNYEDSIENTIVAGKDALKVFLPTYPSNIVEHDLQGKPFVLKLHGTYDICDSIVLTESQYKRVYEDDASIKKIMEYFWNSKVLLFLGCSLQKDYLVNYLSTLSHSELKHTHYAILSAPASEQKKDQMTIDLQTCNIEAIWYPRNKHNKIMQMLQILAEKSSLSQTSQKSVYATKIPDNVNTEQYVDRVAYSAYLNSMSETLGRAILTQYIDYSKDNYPPQNAFKLLCNYIRDSANKNILTILGDPGTGKSTLLSLLFLNLPKENGVFTALIDLHFYDNFNEEDAIINLNLYIEYVEQRVYYHRKSIIFIDGLNTYERTNGSLEKKIYESIDRWYATNKVHFIYSIGILDSIQFPPFVRSKKKRPRAGKELELKPIDTNSKGFRFLIERVLAVLNTIPKSIKGRQKEEKINKFIKLIKMSSGTVASFRTVLFYANRYEDYKEALFNESNGSIFYQYYNSLLGSKLLMTAEQTALFMLGKRNLMEKWLNTYVFKSPTTRDFFFAFYYIELLKLSQFEKLSIFDCIFTPSVNRFLVDLMTLSPQTEDIIVNGLLKNMNKLSIKCQTQGVYLLGRITSDDAKKKARDFLTQFYCLSRSKLEKNNVKQAMLFRSTGISLVYLGGWKDEDDFFQTLLYNETVQMVNLCFHIAYYSTAAYKIGADVILDESKVCSLDNLNMLYNHLHHSVKREENKDSHRRAVNIITLVSLVIHRRYINEEHGHATLPNGFESLLKSISADFSISQVVRAFVGNVLEYLLSPNVYSSAFTTLYKMKSIVRAGWLEDGRNIDRLMKPESDADHTWGCCLLAQSLLTENMSDCPFFRQDECSRYSEEYDKHHIIELLLVHDLPEVYTGDISFLQQGSRHEKRERERNAMQKIAVLDVFPKFKSFREQADLWNEYDKLDTINAKIAYQIDKLEPLIQLFLYRNELSANPRIDERNRWIEVATTQVQTIDISFGSNLLAFLSEYLLTDEFFSS